GAERLRPPLAALVAHEVAAALAGAAGGAVGVKGAEGAGVLRERRRRVRAHRARRPYYAAAAVHDRIERATRAIYRLADAAFARWSCPSSGECCQLAKTGRQPWLWPSEWKLIAARKGPPRADGGCPFLDAAGARCTVYADRPLGCRTFFCGRA